MFSLAYDGSIPVGLEATLLAITLDEDNYLQFGQLPISVAGDDEFEIPVEYGTTDELVDLITSIGE